MAVGERTEALSSVTARLLSCCLNIVGTQCLILVAVVTRSRRDGSLIALGDAAYLKLPPYRFVSGGRSRRAGTNFLQLVAVQQLVVCSMQPRVLDHYLVPYWGNVL